MILINPDMQKWSPGTGGDKQLKVFPD